MTPRAPLTHQLRNREIALELKGRRARVIVKVTTGGGKSAIPPIYAATLIPQYADRLCWVVPRDSLRTQAEEAFTAPWLREWLGASRTIRAAGNDHDPSRGTDGYVTTYQAIAQNPDLHRHEFERWRYVLVLDEFHHVECDSPWHRALLPLVDRAAAVVLMTGTLERGDGKRLAFLEYRPTADGDTPDLSDSAAQSVIRYSRRDALAEEQILPIKFKHFDLSAKWIDRAGQQIATESFDSVTDGQVSDAIYAGLATQYAYELLLHCARDWRGYSLTHTSSRLLVVAHRQRAAKEYVTFLKDRLQIPALVAVSEDGAEAQAAIRKFRHGQAPALITVGMAYEGLDAPGITHIACLTHIRSKPWIEQMLGRAVRVDPAAGKYRAQTAYAYVPDDPLMCEVIEQISREQAPFVREPLEREAGSGSGERLELGSIVALDGAVSALRLTELDGEAMSKDEAAFHQSVLDRAGLTGRIDLFELQRALATAEQVQAEGPTPRIVHHSTPSDDEDKLRERIQTVCSTVDYKCARPHSTTNREIVTRFHKSRLDMTVPELQEVWAYLNRRYPEYIG